MQALTRYFNSDGSLSRKDLSKKIGISAGRLSQLGKAKEWPPELALTAERETGGALDASELSSIIARARQVAA